MKFRSSKPRWRRKEPYDSREVQALNTLVRRTSKQLCCAAKTDCKMAASVGLKADPLRLIAEANKPAMGLDQVRKGPAALSRPRPEGLTS